MSKVHICLTPNDLATQSYLGKNDIFSFLNVNAVEIKTSQVESTVNLIESAENFIDIHKNGNTSHIRYMLKHCSALCQLLREKGPECLTVEVRMIPFFVLKAYIDPVSNQLFAVTKGIDIKKAPDSVWDEAWGKEEKRGRLK